MRICVAGAYGAFGIKHLDALANIDGVEVTSVMGPTQAKIDALAAERGIGHAATTLEECIARDDVDAVILATPTQLHADQAVACMEAGKPVLTGVLAMAGQVRRFNPSHQWIHNKIAAGELKVQQMDVQTYFFRRSNMNAKGEPRSWTDHLLWHHACHTVDLFQYQTGESVSESFGLEGPKHPDLGIAMDMSIGMKTPSGAICTLSLSFNNDGPLGTFFRYICDKGTYIARYDDLFDGYEKPVDLSGVAVSNNGI
ncbi:MAG: Gfo/Idh/MocA family oxidoreductase, partial [Maritimibacter sp.]